MMVIDKMKNRSMVDKNKKYKNKCMVDIGQMHNKIK